MKPSTDALQRTLDPAYRVAQSTEVAHDLIARELERYAGAANPTSMFYFWNRTRREIALSPASMLPAERGRSILLPGDRVVRNWWRSTSSWIQPCQHSHQWYWRRFSRSARPPYGRRRRLCHRCPS
jgi:hypothetical protein